MAIRAVISGLGCWRVGRVSGCAEGEGGGKHWAAERTLTATVLEQKSVSRSSTLGLLLGTAKTCLARLGEVDEASAAASSAATSREAAGEEAGGGARRGWRLTFARREELVQRG